MGWSQTCQRTGLRWDFKNLEVNFCGSEDCCWCQLTEWRWCLNNTLSMVCLQECQLNLENLIRTEVDFDEDYPIKVPARSRFRWAQEEWLSGVASLSPDRVRIMGDRTRRLLSLFTTRRRPILLLLSWFVCPRILGTMRTMDGRTQWKWNLHDVDWALVVAGIVQDNTAPKLPRRHRRRCYCYCCCCSEGHRKDRMRANKTTNKPLSLSR